MTHCARAAAESENDDLPDSGTAAVEFALVLPALLMLIFAAVIAGGVAAGQLTVQSAARDGARIGAISPELGCSVSLARLEDAASLVGSVTCDPVATCPGDESIVRIDARRMVSVPFIGDRTISLSSTSRFRCET